MSRTQRKYDHEYKVQAVKLAREIGGAKAAKELGIPEGTIHTWLKAVRAGTLDMILSILVDTFISKISLPMQPVPEIGSISGA